MHDEVIHFSGIISALIVGLIIGFRHSTDGDHVVAVSTMARDYRNIFKSLWVGISWGLGHSTPLMILGILVLLFKQSILDIYESIAGFFEFGVGLMLVFLGIQVFWKLKNNAFHIHTHDHDGESHKHIHGSHSHQEIEHNPHSEKKHGFFPELFPFFRIKSYTIGVVHGLAGSAAILIAILPATPSFASGMIFLLSFSLGTMISMAIMTIFLSFPILISSKSNFFSNLIMYIAGLLSIMLGVALMSDVGFGTNFTGFLWY
ncbi:MAG: hypothetical protein FI687_03820 [SAR202 cluster bacterium]|nr:hypothetical protein [SAR202 cluster bacterium]